MADPLSRAYLSLKEAPEDQEDVMTVLETRSPTEIKAEQVNMLQYLPVKDKTLQPNPKPFSRSRPSLASSNKAGQKVNYISHWKFKTTFHSKKNLHSKMELFSKETALSHRCK